MEVKIQTRVQGLEQRRVLQAVFGEFIAEIAL
jgi:hypothetical protein